MPRQRSPEQPARKHPREGVAGLGAWTSGASLRQVWAPSSQVSGWCHTIVNISEPQNSQVFDERSESNRYEHQTVCVWLVPFIVNLNEPQKQSVVDWC